ncbi:hypothetical protein SXCC_00037 [Gluconacetobacter sp. SXCC-1]|nr:hypothetical protein SXCC_00037 [Gluconacetobacter sp. SXCC-1]
MTWIFVVSPPREPDPCPFFESSGAVLMCPDNRTVDHHVFIVVIDRQMTKKPFR